MAHNQEQDRQSLMLRPSSISLSAVENQDGIFEMTGTFIETAFTSDEIERTIEAEKRQGIRRGSCAFLGDLGAMRD